MELSRPTKKFVDKALTGSLSGKEISFFQLTSFYDDLTTLIAWLFRDRKSNKEISLANILTFLDLQRLNEKDRVQKLALSFIGYSVKVPAEERVDKVCRMLFMSLDPIHKLMLSTLKRDKSKLKEVVWRKTKA